MANNLTGYHYSIDVASTTKEYVRYMPSEITFNVFTSNNEYVQGDMLTIWYKNRMEEIDLTEYEYYEDITINLLEFREWTGQGEPLGLILSYDDEVQDEVWIEINERMPTIQESIDFVAKRLFDILNEKGIDVSSSVQTKYQRLSPYIELVSGNQTNKTISSTRISYTVSQGTILSFDIGRIYWLKDSTEQDVKLNLNVSTLSVSDNQTEWTAMNGGMNLVIKMVNGVITASCYNSQDTLVFSPSEKTLYVKLTSDGYMQLFITILNGIVDKSVDGLTTLINKVRLLDVYSAPSLDGTDKVTSLIQDYSFTTGDGVGGGYHQCGYLSDGFRNDCDWEISMDLRRSSWDGGFLLLLNPYNESDLDCSTTDKWNCIFNNGQEDILQWIDGYIKTNKGTGLTDTGLTYTRNTTRTTKLIKKSNALLYYENGLYKGKYVWNKLMTAPRVYVGVMTWGGSGSVNTFSNLLYTPIKHLDEYLTPTTNYSYAQGSNLLTKSSDSSPVTTYNILTLSSVGIVLNNEEFIKDNHYQLHFDWRVTNGYDGGFGMGTTDDYWMFSQQNSQAIVQHGKLDNDSGGGDPYQTIQSSQRFSSYVPVIITRKGNNWTIDINQKALFFSFEADQPNCFGLRKWTSGTCQIRNLWVTDIVPKDTTLSIDLTEHHGSVWVDGALADEFDNPLANKKIIIEVNGSVTETLTTNSNGSFETEGYDSSIRQSFVCKYEGDVIYTASSENVIWEI